MEKQQIFKTNDFILLHVFPTEGCVLLRISNIKAIIEEQCYTYISMFDNSYYSVKESVPEIFKMIQLNESWRKNEREL